MNWIYKIPHLWDEPRTVWEVFNCGPKARTKKSRDPPNGGRFGRRLNLWLDAANVHRFSLNYYKKWVGRTFGLTKAKKPT